MPADVAFADGGSADDVLGEALAECPFVRRSSVPGADEDSEAAAFVRQRQRSQQHRPALGSLFAQQDAELAEPPAGQQAGALHAIAEDAAPAAQPPAKASAPASDAGGDPDLYYASVPAALGARLKAQLQRHTQAADAGAGASAGASPGGRRPQEVQGDEELGLGHYASLPTAPGRSMQRRLAAELEAALAAEDIQAAVVEDSEQRTDAAGQAAALKPGASVAGQPLAPAALLRTTSSSELPSPAPEGSAVLPARPPGLPPRGPMRSFPPLAPEGRAPLSWEEYHYTVTGAAGARRPASAGNGW